MRFSEFCFYQGKLTCKGGFVKDIVFNQYPMKEYILVGLRAYGPDKSVFIHRLSVPNCDLLDERVNFDDFRKQFNRDLHAYYFIGDM